MKFLVLAAKTPSRELMLGVKVVGRSAMACGRGPRFRGDPSMVGEEKVSRPLLGVKPVMRLKAVYRVACLESGGCDYCGTTSGAIAKAKIAFYGMIAAMKPAWQKRIETAIVLSRKTPRLYRKRELRFRGMSGDYSVV